MFLTDPRSPECFLGRSDYQLLVLHVAARYKFRRRSRMGWSPVGYELPDKYVPTHLPSVIRSLLERGLLEGNKAGEKVGLQRRYKASTETPLVWISAKGKALLNKIGSETGLVLDEVNYQLVEPDRMEGMDGIDLGNCYSERKAISAYDRAISLLNEDEAENMSS
jgi:hypothetical protein